MQATGYKIADAQRERFLSAISMLKLETGCVDCGYDSDPAALDFDHVRGEKTLGVGQMRGHPWERVFAEIDKCEVVCANCHRIRTSNRRRNKCL